MFAKSFEMIIKNRFGGRQTGPGSWPCTWTGTWTIWTFENVGSGLALKSCPNRTKQD